MPCTNLFRLSPGLTGGTWHHDLTPNVATIVLNFSGVAEPVTLTITGDCPARLAGKRAGVFGYDELPEDEAASGDPLEPAAKVADYAAALDANNAGIAPRYELDDDGGVSVTWCSAVTRQPIGNAKFLVNRTRAL
jgi:hypothetical protein